MIFAKVPPSVWTTPWVVHSKPVGSGRPALVYLSRYVYRVALSNRNILRMENGLVTFRWRDSQSGRWRRMTMPAEEFIRRFLQHVLPSRLVKVRHFGLHHPASRHRLDLARARIAEAAGLPVPPRAAPTVRMRPVLRCPGCGVDLVLQGLRRPGLPFLPCASAAARRHPHDASPPLHPRRSAVYRCGDATICPDPAETRRIHPQRVLQTRIRRPPRHRRPVDGAISTLIPPLRRIPPRRIP